MRINFVNDSRIRVARVATGFLFPTRVENRFDHLQATIINTTRIKM